VLWSSLIAGENSRPKALCFEDYFDGFTDGRVTACALRHVVGGFFYLRPRVSYRDGQTDPPHHNQVRHIVARVSDLIRGYFGVGHDLLKNRDLVEVTLVNIIHVELAGPLHGGRRITAADDPGFDAVVPQPAKRQAILRIESLGLNHLSHAVREMVDVSIRQNAVDVHKKKSDLCGAAANVLFY